MRCATSVEVERWALISSVFGELSCVDEPLVPCDLDTVTCGALVVGYGLSLFLRVGGRPDKVTGGVMSGL